MGKTLCICVILLLGSLAVTGCGLSQSATTEANSGAANSGMTNSELQARVRAQLDTDLAIRSAHLLVDTDAEKHELVLSGTVKSEELRDKAVQLAQNAVQGITVKNNITVRTPETAHNDSTAGKSPLPEKQHKRH